MKEKLSRRGNAIILFVLLVIYPFMCGIYDNQMRGLHEDLAYGKAFLVSEIGVVFFAVYALAGLFFIKKMVQSRWRIGYIVTLVILLIYTVLVPAVMMLHVSFLAEQAMVLMQVEYKIIAAIMLIYALLYFVYWKKYGPKDEIPMEDQVVEAIEFTE